jgi:hypothetical protein
MNKQLLAIRAARVLVVLAAIGLLMGLYLALFDACFVAVIAVILGPIVVLLCGRSNPVRAAKYSLIATTLAVGIYVGNYAYDAMPNRLFKRYVMPDVPASVQILDGKYYGRRDPSVFLHFRLNRQDFDKLLGTRKYTLEGTYSPPAGDEPTTMPSPKLHSWGLAPDWWRPEELHEPTLYRTKLAPTPTDASEIWVNEERTEVYFAVIYF